MRIFGDFEFDEKAMQLRRAGGNVPISGQCLDLLVLLLDRSGQLVTREEISHLLWPDISVDSKHSVDVLVSRLRTVLGDDGPNRRYIHTLPKKGYRFVQEVRFDAGGCDSFNAHRLGSFARYAWVAVVAGLLALLIAHTRYQKFVPLQGAPEYLSHR